METKYKLIVLFLFLIIVMSFSDEETVLSKHNEILKTEIEAINKSISEKETIFKSIGDDHIEISGKRIFVELAKTYKEVHTGLMFRKELCTDCGMLFMLEKEKIYSVWMKNVLIPLDIIFINSSMEIVDILHTETCEEKLCQLYKSKYPANYILETNINLFNEEIIGSKVKIFITPE
ncbi:MAG: DUF192 domain-containing protein [Patescibacteria group bacterium]|nr:DUF192 domain-containing protein [Patescibacteria group bacterium]